MAVSGGNQGQSIDPAQWVDHHGDALYRYAVTRLRHADAAEEVVQETFLDVLKALPRYRVEGPARFETWLYTVTSNRCKMRWRRKQLPTDDWDEVGERLAQVPNGHSDRHPEQASEQAETRHRIWQTVGRLSDLYREVILLRYGHDFSYQEIAEALNLSMGTVKSRLNAAHRQLQNFIAANGQLAQEIAGRRRTRRKGPSLGLWLWAF